MRRAEREITEQAEVEAILERAPVLTLALRDEPAPYVVPVSFGYEQGTLYVHSAPRGAKLDLIARDPLVGFSACADYALVRGDAACDCGVRASSVVGTGAARVVTDEREKLRGLDAIMRHYGEGRPVYNQETLARTCLIAIAVRSMRGKRLG
jgi:nitroimidazol reductase NimA-like FMN-containing flavoprotein (pyridoxamine 5'-phosphate oxidase superfamily)